MAHTLGSVNSFREALVEVRLKSGEAIDCVVDTGFDGGLMLRGLSLNGYESQSSGVWLSKWSEAVECFRRSD